MVLAGAMGRSNARIARDLRISQDTVRNSGGAGSLSAAWKDSVICRGPGGRGRSARRCWAAVVALACQLPAATGVPLAHWTGPELAAELTARNLVSFPVSASSVLRISLAEHPVKPWQYQSWIYPRDPDFEAKAKVILDLYQGCYQGEPVSPANRVLSFDAKPQICARSRLHPTLPAARGKPVRYEHEYKRKGSSRCSPGWTCAQEQVIGSTPQTTGIKPFMDLAGQVIAQPSTRARPRVFVIVDNGSDHRGQAGQVNRLRTAHPNAIMIHTRCTPPG